MSRIRAAGAPAAADIQLAATEALHAWGPGTAQGLTGISRGTLAAIAAGLPVRARTVARADTAFERLGWDRERLEFKQPPPGEPRLRLVQPLPNPEQEPTQA